MADPEGRVTDLGCLNKRHVDRMVEYALQNWPRAYKACCPRNIVVPKGYADTRFYSAISAAHIFTIQGPTNELAHRTAYCIAASLITNKFPYYFIADEFATAVANTDLPGDFKFAELKWPMEAQVFVLSEAFCQSYYGFQAPFLAAARIPKGPFPNAKLPPTEFVYRPELYGEDRILMDHSFYSAETCVTYNGSYGIKDDIRILKEAPWNDATLLENVHYGCDLTPKGSLSPEAEAEFIDKSQQLLVKLLLTIAERPALVEHGKVTRHAQVTQQGVVKLPQLVSANIIGRAYRIPKKFSTTRAATGPRAKPRFKYRRGHHTWQAKRFKAIEFISVDQMPRREDGFMDFDKAGEEMSAKFRACHERLWIDGFLFEETAETVQNPTNPVPQST